MKSKASWKLVCAFSMLGFLLVLSNGREAFAGLIIYDFEGSCVSAFGNGCGAFDLTDGDSVSGVFSFEESLVVPGASNSTHWPIDAWC